MAEFVQHRSEEWVDILMECERLELLKSQEIKEISKTVKEKEYNVQKSTRSLEDILDYVNFQVEVLKKLKNRRKRLDISEKRIEIDFAIMNRINSLFGNHKRNFGNDLSYWEAKLQFAIGQNWTTNASKTLEEACVQLGTKHPYLYKRASDMEWKLNHEKNIHSARHILQNGLRRNKGHIPFYVWMFGLEIRYANFVLDKDEVTKKSKMDSDFVEESEKSIKAAQALFNIAVKEWKADKKSSIKGPELYYEFFTIVRDSRFSDLVEEILKRIESDFKTDEMAYEMLAKIFHVSMNDYRTAVKKLEKGLMAVKSKKMYDVAIQHLEMCAANNFENASLPKLHEIFCRGLDQDLLSSNAFRVWLRICDSYIMTDGQRFSEVEKAKVALTAIDRYPEETTFLTEMLKLYMTKNSKEDIERTIANVTKKKLKFDNDFFKLVLMYREMYNNNLDHSTLVKLVSISPEFSSKYLEHVCLVGGVESMRKIYRLLPTQDSYPVLKTVAYLEFTNLNHSADTEEKRNKPFRFAMEKACLSFGRENIDVWIDYIQYEQRLGNGDKVSEIQSRAMQILSGQLREDFMQRVAKML